jgi:hypothetical protein
MVPAAQQARCRPDARALGARRRGGTQQTDIGPPIAGAQDDAAWRRRNAASQRRHAAARAGAASGARGATRARRRPDPRRSPASARRVLSRIARPAIPEGNMVRIAVLAFVLVDFVALSAWAVSVHGYVGFFEAMAASAASKVAFVDLTIALSLAALWMVGDARERRLPFWPYLALTLALGSVGPLAYLLHRELRAYRAAPAHRVTA